MTYNIAQKHFKTVGRPHTYAVVVSASIRQVSRALAWRTCRRTAGWPGTAYREDIMATEAYCVKCREKREMEDEEEVTMKNGRQAVQGKCPVCGTKLFRIKSTKKEE